MKFAYRVSALTLLAVAIIAMAGCNLFEIKPDLIENTVFTVQNGTRIVIASGGTRLLGKDEEITLVEKDLVSAPRSAKAIQPLDTFKIKAQVEAPTVGGDLLGATSVVIEGDMAYVTYNLRGADHRGAVDIVDITDTGDPRLIQSISFSDMDVNGAFVKSGYLFLIGGMDYSHLADLVEQSTGQAQNPDNFAAYKAIVERIALNADGTVDSSGIENSIMTYLPGYQATSIFSPPGIQNSPIFVTCGDHESAGFFALDAQTLAIVDQQIFDDAKYLHISDAPLQPAIVVLKGSKNGGNGTLKVDRVASGEPISFSDISIGAVQTNETKNTVFLYSDVAYLGLGAGGMKAFDINDSESFDEPAYYVGSSSFDEANDIVCNAVTSDARYIYVAAGEGGVWISPRDYAGEDGELPIYSSINFGTDKSANFVITDPERHVLFAAGGEAGFMIISYETDYRIGDYGPGGGLIFYDKGSYSDGWRYIEAGPHEIANKAQWGGRGTFVNTGNDGYGEGEANTATIVSKLGTTYSYAARLCAEYEYNDKDDWYLPTLTELDAMYENLYLNKVGNFNPSWHWSSTEANKDNAWRRTFNKGIKTKSSSNLKYNQYIVRPVRKF